MKSILPNNELSPENETSNHNDLSHDSAEEIIDQLRSILNGNDTGVEHRQESPEIQRDIRFQRFVTWIKEKFSNQGHDSIGLEEILESESDFVSNFDENVFKVSEEKRSIDVGDENSTLKDISKETHLIESIDDFQKIFKVDELSLIHI